jgi:hypothetical protein
VESRVLPAAEVEVPELQQDQDAESKGDDRILTPPAVQPPLYPKSMAAL